MKKIFLAGLVFLSCMTVLSQDLKKLNLYQHKINLKYGVGFEMFNFRFEQPVSFRNEPGKTVFIDDVNFTKNKLLVKYLTVPVQINFSPNPTNKKGFYASIGMSAGYLWNAKRGICSCLFSRPRFRWKIG